MSVRLARQSAPSTISLSVAVVSAVSMLLLAGCTLLPTTGAATPGELESTPTASPSGTATPIPGITGTPVAATCDELISADTIYTFNPNIVPLGAFTPADNSPAATAVAAQGLACRYQNQTSGENVDLSVADLDATSLATIESGANGDPVPGIGDSAFFATSGGVGTLTVFSGSYWVTLSSVFFSTASDATDLITPVLEGLPA